MARSYGEKAEKLCFSCNPVTAGKMHDPLNDPFFTANGHCSWCLNEGEMYLIRPGITGRNSYECSSCHRKTLKCRLCDGAFARGYAEYNDESCYVCSDIFDDWETANLDEVDEHRWCSWCFDLTSHRLDQSNVIRRSIYQCKTCLNRTLRCTNCDIAMTKGGTGWDDSTCHFCLNPSVDDSLTWEIFRQQLEDKYNFDRDLDFVRLELIRDSKYRERAKSEGLLRPFLILVSMHPNLRNKVSSALGWSLFSQEYAGDVHREAWDILTSKPSGMRTRTYEATERINFFSKPHTYYDIVKLVGSAIFLTMPSLNINYGSKKNLSNSDDKLIIQLEEEFLVRLFKRLRATVRPKKAAELTEEQKESLEELANVIKEKTGFTRTSAVMYSMSVIESFSPISKIQLFLLALNQSVILIPSISGVVGPISALLGTFAIPLMIYGIYKLITTGIDMAIGASKGRVLGPLICILNQSIILALEDIDISDYLYAYEPNE